MTAVMTDSPVAMFAAGVDALLSCDLDALSCDGLLDLVRTTEVQRRRLAAVDHRLIAALEERGVPGEVGAATVTGLLRDLLILAPGEARARTRAAADLASRHTLTGQPQPPAFAHVAAAQAVGAVGVEQARAIVRGIEQLPDALQAEHGDGMERELVGYALDPAFVPDEQGDDADSAVVCGAVVCGLDAQQLTIAARRIRDYLDPDGTAVTDDDHERWRDLQLRSRRDGSGEIKGRLTPAALAVWQAVFDSLSRPAPATPGGSGEPEDTTAHDTPAPEADCDGSMSTGEPPVADERTAAQRRHDAFEDAGHRLLRSDLPETGGAAVTLNVTVPLTDLEDRTGMVSTPHGGTISVNALLRMAAEAELVPVVLGAHLRGGRRNCPDAATHRIPHDAGSGAASEHHDIRRSECSGDACCADDDGLGGVLAYGRTRRHASPAQRRVLAARDGGCSFPGCTAPSAWTQAHHVIAWLIGGLTDIDNLTLLCGYHHRNFERLGWSCRMSRGRPQWTPPAWLDPGRRPRRNLTGWRPPRR